MKIGIEKSLTNVKEYLEQNNQQVGLLDGSKTKGRSLKKYDTIVASGLDSNFLGMHDTSTKNSVINADGKTAEEVFNEIKSKQE